MLALCASLLCAVIPPVPGTVIQRFVAPACARCPGHRGVTIQSPPGVPVVAVSAGEVVFAGEVAGVLYVVHTIAPGVKVTYGWLRALTPNIGHVVNASSPVHVNEGEPLGISGARTYIGVRVHGVYVDPLRILGLSGSRLTGVGGIVGQRGHPR